MSRAFRTSRPLLVHVLGFPEGDANTTPSVVHVASPSGKKMSATVVHVRATEGMRVRATRPLLSPSVLRVRASRRGNKSSICAEEGVARTRAPSVRARFVRNKGVTNRSAQIEDLFPLRGREGARFVRAHVRTIVRVRGVFFSHLRCCAYAHPFGCTYVHNDLYATKNIFF